MFALPFKFVEHFFFELLTQGLRFFAEHTESAHVGHNTTTELGEMNIRRVDVTVFISVQLHEHSFVLFLQRSWDLGSRTCRRKRRHNGEQKNKELHNVESTREQRGGGEKREAGGNP